MENASKALIIAAAILLSILIIALGMRVYNNASSSAGSADLSSQEISSYNSQFESYEGRQKGTNVKTLLNLISKNNIDYKDRKITVSFTGEANGTPSDITDSLLSTTVKSSTTFKVVYTYNGHDGLIDTCTITVYN